MITVIRYSDKETIPIVGGFDWDYDLTPLHNEPINATGLLILCILMPIKSPQLWAATWEENYGFAADTWPVFATEFSHDSKDIPGTDRPGKGICLRQLQTESSRKVL